MSTLREEIDKAHPAFARPLGADFDKYPRRNFAVGICVGTDVDQNANLAV